MSLHDWSINEMFAPVWVEPGFAVCTEGVSVPLDAKDSLRLVQSESFGTGGHPKTRAALAAYRRVRSTHMGSDARVLDFCAGSGILGFYAKTHCRADHVVACVDPADFDTIAANERLNFPLNEILIPGRMCSFAEREMFAGYFDIVVTHAGCLDMVPRFEFLEKVTARTGAIIFAGHNAATHRPIVHHLAEYFEIVEINDFSGWPVVIAQPLNSKPVKLDEN